MFNYLPQGQHGCLGSTDDFCCQPPCLLSVQGAKVTANIVAGLVVDGSADVTIANSDFLDNNREKYGGSALIAGGTSNLRIAGTRFNKNGHESDDTYGGEDMQQ